MIDSGVDLHTAAERLGVHYQTAYSWVRTGALPAMRVGRRYVIDPAALDAFDRERRKPRRPASRKPRSGFAARLDRFHAALLAGDEAAAAKLVRDYLDTGTSITELTEGLLGPAMRRIGDDWACGDTTAAHEHRASAIVERILGSHVPNRRGRRRGVAVVASGPGDRHGLPTLMAAAALRDDGWTVHHLGPDLPLEQVADFARAEQVDLVVLSATTTDDAARAERWAATRPDGPRVLVGHPGARLTDLLTEARTGRRQA